MRYSKLVDASVEYWCSDNRSGSNSKSWLGLRVVGMAAGTCMPVNATRGSKEATAESHIYYAVAWQPLQLAAASWDISIAVATCTTSHGGSLTPTMLPTVLVTKSSTSLKLNACSW